MFDWYKEKICTQNDPVCVAAEEGTQVHGAAQPGD